MFKQKIIDKYAKNLDDKKLKAAYEDFKSYQAKAEYIKEFKDVRSLVYYLDDLI